MKHSNNRIIIAFIMVLVFPTFSLFAQATKTINGIAYTIIEPTTFAFNADNGTVKVGQKYYIEGKVAMMSGASLMMVDVGAKTDFILPTPMKLGSGTQISVYFEITEANAYSIKAKIIKIEGAGVPSGTGKTDGGSKNLDGVVYTVIEPTTFAFNADNGTVKVGQKYYIEGKVAMMSGASLMMVDVGAKTDFILPTPMKLGSGTQISVYFEITEANAYSIKAKIIKIENK